jgi:preprotein translocase subunit Sec61beta
MSNAARVGGRDRAVRLAGARGPGVARRALVTLELVTGVAGLAGGVLLAAAPDGSLLRADLAVLAGTPFSDWRVPGVLLAGLVGGGFLLAGWWQWRGHRHARELSMAAGAGLVCFEAGELGWIGFQPLEAVFAAVGVSIIVLAWRLPGTQP